MEYFLELLCPFSILILIFGIHASIIREYESTTYYKITHNGYYKTRRDSGLRGEYRIFDKLKFYETTGARFLFNFYIPKGNDQTAEIDVLMIDKKGLFVFESKNYSGWIFGNEKYQNWTQTLPQGAGRRAQKKKFFNPIMQNKGHISALKRIIGEDKVCHSIVVFSDDCEFKSVTLTSGTAIVVKRDILRFALNNYMQKKEDVFTEEQIEKLYNQLYPYTQVDESVKIKHIESIRHTIPKNEHQDNKIVAFKSRNNDW